MRSLLHCQSHQSVWQHGKSVWMVAAWLALCGLLMLGESTLSMVCAATPDRGPASTTGALLPSLSMTAGWDAYQRGDLEQAVSSWQEAVRFYADTGQPHSQSVALTHLAHAYMALGHYDQAQQSLHTALQLAEQTGEPAQVAMILDRLGTIAMETDRVVEAERLLERALTLVRQLGNVELTATILHTRGNLFMAMQRPQDALEAYRNSAVLAQQARQAGIAARAFAHAAAAAEHNAQPQTAKTLLDEAREHLRQAEPSHDTVYDLVLIGRAYHRLATAEPGLRLRAAEVFQEAATLAQALHNPRALAYAWGYLGRLYEQEQRYQEALSLTRRAVLAAQQVHAPESLYLWQWQTGRLLRALGDLPQATVVYERAMATVQSMRTELLHGSGGASSAFRTALGPLYFELADLYLRQAAALEARAQGVGTPQYEQYLQQARLAVEQFKTAELRDYFGDECVAATPPRLITLERVSPEAVIVYPILLPERTELLVSLPSGLKRVEVPVTGADLEQRVRIFRNALDRRDRFRYLQHAQQLYAWLLRPLEAELSRWQIKTLVFVPDGALRLLPFAALHDGQRYLIEKYALAITPSLTLTDPQPLPPGKVPVLAAGVTHAVEDLPALPHVAEELQNLQRLYGGSVLLDQDFGPEQLDKMLRKGAFGIIHIAAHGQFAANAAQSFLLTTQGRLTFARLAEMLGRLRFREQPIELLTLSACATALGDDRAALGLAGVAIQAGARSAMGTLWLVRDDAAAILMAAFYQLLQRPGASRAWALQQAQLTLLRSPQYADPFFWASFLLINNWL